MDMNLIGRIGNLSLSRENVLFPLFETISNSMHSIEEGAIKNGEIIVSILRDTTQTGAIHFFRLTRRFLL
jgi:hypothetical protein